MEQQLQLFLKTAYGEIVGDKKVFLNCSLTRDPIIEEDFIALPFNGTFVINESDG